MRTLGLACVLLLVWVGGAQAKREQSFRYPYSRVWSSALRMLRVDFESPISEKDQDSGYFLFEFPDGGKQHAGSVELVRSSDGGVETVRVVITIAALPTYVEQMLLDRLTKKLTQEFGDPPEQAPSAPKRPAPPSDGTDKGGDKPAAKPKEPKPGAPPG